MEAHEEQMMQEKKRERVEMEMQQRRERVEREMQQRGKTYETITKRDLEDFEFDEGQLRKIERLKARKRARIEMEMKTYDTLSIEDLDNFDMDEDHLEEVLHNKGREERALLKQQKMFTDKQNKWNDFLEQVEKEESHSYSKHRAEDTLAMHALMEQNSFVVSPFIKCILPSTYDKFDFLSEKRDPNIYNAFPVDPKHIINSTHNMFHYELDTSIGSVCIVSHETSVEKDRSTRVLFCRTSFISEMSALSEYGYALIMERFTRDIVHIYNDEGNCYIWDERTCLWQDSKKSGLQTLIMHTLKQYIPLDPDEPPPFLKSTYSISVDRFSCIGTQP